MQYRCAKSIATRCLQSASERNVMGAKGFCSVQTESPQKQSSFKKHELINNRKGI
jgi:hypothetical protein